MTERTTRIQNQDDVNGHPIVMIKRPWTEDNAKIRIDDIHNQQSQDE
jgi:hypothetical protein